MEIVLPTSKVSDFVWTVYSEPIITGRVRTLFEAEGLTGVRYDPVTVRKVKYSRAGTKPFTPELSELTVVGKGGDASADSGIRLLFECPACGLKRYSSYRAGIVVDPRQWDGSDFFTVNGYPRIIVVTEEVKDLVIRERLTNCFVVRSRDLLWGDYSRPEDHPENFAAG